MCGYASGKFSDVELHYHMVYKEFLAVKYGIKKFEFHLIGHRFKIHMKNSSFPRVLDFKNKTIPDKQLLRWKEWFSRYDFFLKYIKGKDNILPDLLSRPPKLISLTEDFLLILMVGPSPTKKQKFSLTPDVFCYRCEKYTDHWANDYPLFRIGFYGWNTLDPG